MEETVRERAMRITAIGREVQDHLLEAIPDDALVSEVMGLLGALVCTTIQAVAGGCDYIYLIRMFARCLDQMVGEDVEDE